MQRQRSGLGLGLDLFPEAIDLNQGSPPNNNTSNTDALHPPNTINQMETQFPSYTRVATNADTSLNPVITVDNETAPSFTGWARGESSSSGFNPQEDESRNDTSKSRLGWSSSSSSYNPTSLSENWFFEPVNVSTSITGYHGAVRPQSSQSQSYYGSNCASLNISRNPGHVREGGDNSSQRGHVVLGAALPHNIYKPDVHLEIEQLPSFYPSSSSNLVEHNDASGSAFAAWGVSSCKRKAAEGTSGSSSSSQLTGKNTMMQHHHGSGNMIISSGPLNPSLNNHFEHQNTSAAVNLGRNFSSRSNLGQETVPRDEPVGSSYRVFGVTRDSTRPVSTGLRIDPNNSLNQAGPTHVTAHSSPSPWNGSFSSSQYGGSSSIEEANRPQSSRGNILHCPAEATNQIDWSFAPEASNSSRNNRMHGSRGESNSNAVRASSSSSSWLPHHYHHQHHHHHHQASSHNHHHQRFSEAAPWVQYPRTVAEGDDGNNGGGGNNRRSHFGFIPSVSSSEAGSSSRARRQLDQRSAAALLMDISGDDVSGWSAITAVEERHRLIRQVLNAMRRGVRLQAEDYMAFDPYLDEFAELHDRHRDMRLDVDNMSYEELLALEETIGNVSTGLSEEKITASLRQRKHINSKQNSEPCCICQEEYVVGDFIGVLDCTHEFHTSCIKQWLTQKNLCPICKMTALEET